MSDSEISKLLRVLTLKDAVGVGLGAIIGAGGYPRCIYGNAGSSPQPYPWNKQDDVCNGTKKSLPPVLQKIHPKKGIPHVGIFLTGGIILLLCFIGTFEFILASAAFTILLH